MSKHEFRRLAACAASMAERPRYDCRNACRNLADCVKNTDVGIVVTTQSAPASSMRSRSLS